MRAEGEDPVQDRILLHNRGVRPVAYRIRVSVQNKFVLRPSEGVLEAGQSGSVGVVLKGFPSSDIPSDGVLAKFAVELLDCDDSYYVMGSKSFWLALGASCVTRKLLGRVAPLERPDEPSVVLSLGDSVSVSPDALVFRGECLSVAWCGMA